MKDRIVQHANRYKLTQVSGDIYNLTPEPGIVTEPGTDISKANLLKDTTAALYGLDDTAVPDEAFALIATALSERAKVAYVSYTGTGLDGASNPNSLTFAFAPQLMFIQTRGGSGYTAFWIRQEYNAAYQLNMNVFGVNGSVELKNYSKHSNEGKTISWYAYSGGAVNQLNESGVDYDVTVIGLGA